MIPVTQMKTRARILLGASVIVIAFGATAAAGPLDDGIAAYHDKDYAKAVALWRPLAESGDRAAEYYLGTLYAEGNGVAHDDATAFMWFQRAASQGHAAAQYNVGASYASGTGVDKSSADAAKWFRRAADQGMVFAQINLALLYAAGNGVPHDNVEAFKWLEVAFGELAAGGPRMDVARAMKDVAANMTSDEIDEAKRRAHAWKAHPEGK